MESCGFFDAKLNGNVFDRQYLADNFAKYFASFIGNGIFPDQSTGVGLQAVQLTTPNMSVNIKTGKGWINGYWYENNAVLNKAIQVADGVLNRIDLIVLRWGAVERAMWVEVIKGTPAATALEPVFNRNSNYYDLVIAKISIPKGTTSITQAAITDARLSSDCGVVAAIVDQVDTSDIYSQFMSWYTSNTATWQNNWNTWFNSIQGGSYALAANVAPSGYGLGAKPRTAVDLNNCYTAGWYAGNDLLHSPITGGVKVLVIPYTENSPFCTQLAFGIADNSSNLMFIRTDFGVWHKVYTDAKDNLEELQIPVEGNNELIDTATYYPSYWTIGGATVNKMKGMLTGVRSTAAFSPAARQDYACTIGETYTLSAWVRSNVAGTIASITSSGWVTADVNASKNTLVIANKWYRYKFTFTATDSNSKGFALESNISCTFDVCGMQLEKGTAATGYAKNVWDKIV